MLRIMKTGLLVAFIFCLQVAPASAVEFGLFGDVSFRKSDKPGSNDAFAIGGLDFYATQAMSDKTRAFVEFVLENTDTGLVTDLERVWISHAFDDSFVVAAGRFHTPLGLWNRTFHHGSMLQDTIARPFFLDFEDGAAGILPVHLVGLMMTGDFIISSGEISYELGLGNGPSLNTSVSGFAATSTNKPELEINNTADSNSDKAAILRVIYKLDSIPLQTAVFGMASSVAESNGTGSAVAAIGVDLVDQTIIGFDILFDNDSFDFMAEYYSIENENLVGTAGTYTATAYYVQLGYRFTETLKLVARYEDLSFDANDSYFRLLGTQEASHNVLALRYDIDESKSIKFEIHEADFATGTDVTNYTIQWAFLVP